MIASELREFLPSLRDLGVLAANPGLAPWAKFFRPPGFDCAELSPVLDFMLMLCLRFGLRLRLSSDLKFVHLSPHASHQG